MICGGVCADTGKYGCQRWYKCVPVAVGTDGTDLPRHEGFAWPAVGSLAGVATLVKQLPGGNAGETARLSI